MIRSGCFAGTLAFLVCALFPDSSRADSRYQRAQPPEQDLKDLDLATLMQMEVGIRASLDRSLAHKRDASAIVDVISDEDLGKFPARNVADAIGNIPGIVVSRTRGAEGQFVHVRGLGEGFALVTLNGRILPTDNLTRSFAFDVLPSEMISGAQVSKSAEAAQLEGGVGGVIDLRSPLPFDLRGTHLSSSIEGEYGDLARSGGLKVSGVASTRFNDNRMGALLAVTYSERKIRTDILREYSLPAQSTEADLAVDFNGNGVIDQSSAQYIFPTFYGLGTVLGKRERTGATGALQWQATDALLLTLDGLFTHYDSPTRNYSESYFLSPRLGDDPGDTSFPLRWDPGSIRTDPNGVVTNFAIHDLVPEILTNEEPRTVNTSQLGFHAQWHKGDRLDIDLDSYWSRARRDSVGQFRFVVAGIPGATGTFATRDNDLPDLQITLADGRPLSAATDADYRAHFIGISGDLLEDTVYGASLDSTWHLDFHGLRSLQFGATHSRRTKDEAADSNEATACSFCGYPFTFASIGASVIGPSVPRGLLSDRKGDFPRVFGTFEIDRYLDALHRAENNPDVLDPLTGEEYPAGHATQIEAPNLVGSFAIEEKTSAGYVQANFGGEKWRGNVGARLAHTSVGSSGAANQIIRITKRPDNTADYEIERSDATPVSGGGSYTRLLPAANAWYDLRPHLRLRLAAARSMARPSLDQLSMASTDDDASSGQFVKNYLGNPDLKPTIARQADVSLEWYFADRSLLAAAVFYKSVKNFITTTTQDEPYAGQIFSVTRVVNGDSAKIKGAEITAQHFLDNGLGAQLSFTRTSATAIQGNTRGELQDVTPHSYRGSLIYEQKRISGQLSYTYDAPTTVLLSGQIPGLAVQADAYENASFTLGYAITPQISAFVEGTNLLDESSRQFNTYRNVPAFYEQSGRSYFVGARARL